MSSLLVVCGLRTLFLFSEMAAFVCLCPAFWRGQKTFDEVAEGSMSPLRRNDVPSKCNLTLNELTFFQFSESSWYCPSQVRAMESVCGAQLTHSKGVSLQPQQELPHSYEFPRMALVFCHTQAEPSRDQSMPTSLWCPLEGMKGYPSLPEYTPSLGTLRSSFFPGAMPSSSSKQGGTRNLWC